MPLCSDERARTYTQGSKDPGATITPHQNIARMEGIEPSVCCFGDSYVTVTPHTYMKVPFSRRHLQPSRGTPQT